jgi:hypothetical protein
MMKMPALTAAVVKDDEALGDAIDKVILSAPTSRKLTKKVLRAQARLQRAVDEQAWRQYLRLEEAVNDRIVFEGRLLVRWAFREGLRHRSRRRRA